MGFMHARLLTLAAILTGALACERTAPARAPTPVEQPVIEAAADERRCVPERPRVCATFSLTEHTLTVHNEDTSPVRIEAGVEGLTNAVPKGNSVVTLELAAANRVTVIELEPLDAKAPLAVQRWWIALPPDPSAPTASSAADAGPSSSSVSSSESAPDPATLPCNAFESQSVCAVSIPMKEGGARVFVRNTERAVVTARFTPQTPGGQPIVLVVDAGKTQELTTMSEEKWRGTLTWLFGRLDAALKDDVFELPWDKGEKRYVSQAAGGDFSHVGEQAWDFNMETGTRVRAARGGVVAFASDGSTIGGGVPAFKEDGNVSLVVHDDGTVALYGHLRFAGAWKNVGERLDAGDLLALSGNTGFSTGPHLHFQVMRPTKDGAYETLPVRFRGASGPLSLMAPGFVEH
jgi:murein DD-endopeptidase MepM/ murein hydrolase activator NlpD